VAVTDLKWEFAPGFTMLDGSPTWVNLSTGNPAGGGFVRQASIWRGRRSVDGRFATAIGSTTLDNRDGRFNPENTAGAYSPDVQIGTPFRATILIGPTTYPIFYGSARAWPPAYPKTQDSYVTVPLVDGFYNLNLEDLAGESYPEQDSAARIGAVLDDVSWPAGLRDLDTALANVQAKVFASPNTGGDWSALAHLLDVAEAEAGVLFMSRDGKVTFRNRVANSGAVPSATFTDANMQALTLSYDDDHLFNRIRISREDGAQIEVANTSIPGRRYLTRDVMPMSNDAEALSNAEWLAELFGEQRLRVEGLTLKMYAGVSHLEDVLGLELRDYINVTHVPTAGDTIDQDCAVEAIRHDWVPGQWTTTLSVAPLATIETQDYWQLGVAGKSELGVTTRLA
jgi:hypothetical protein